MLFQTASVHLSDIDAELLAVFFGSKGVSTAPHPPDSRRRQQR
jgi:hypothetical protein